MVNLHTGSGLSPLPSFESLCDTGCLKSYLKLDLNFFLQHLTHYPDQIRPIRPTKGKKSKRKKIQYIIIIKKIVIARNNINYFPIKFNSSLFNYDVCVPNNTFRRYFLIMRSIEIECSLKGTGISAPSLFYFISIKNSISPKF